VSNIQKLKNAIAELQEEIATPSRLPQQDRTSNSSPFPTNNTNQPQAMTPFEKGKEKVREGRRKYERLKKRRQRAQRKLLAQVCERIRVGDKDDIFSTHSYVAARVRLGVHTGIPLRQNDRDSENTTKNAIVNMIAKATAPMPQLNIRIRSNKLNDVRKWITNRIKERLSTIKLADERSQTLTEERQALQRMLYTHLPRLDRPLPLAGCKTNGGGKGVVLAGGDRKDIPRLKALGVRETKNAQGRQRFKFDLKFTDPNLALTHADFRRLYTYDAMMQKLKCAIEAFIFESATVGTVSAVLADKHIFLPLCETLLVRFSHNRKKITFLNEVKVIKTSATDDLGKRKLTKSQDRSASILTELSARGRREGVMFQPGDSVWTALGEPNARFVDRETAVGMLRRYVQQIPRKDHHEPRYSELMRWYYSDSPAIEEERMGPMDLILEYYNWYHNFMYGPRDSPSLPPPPSTPFSRRSVSASPRRSVSASPRRSVSASPRRSVSASPRRSVSASRPPPTPPQPSPPQPSLSSSTLRRLLQPSPFNPFALSPPLQPVTEPSPPAPRSPVAPNGSLARPYIVRSHKDAMNLQAKKGAYVKVFTGNRAKIHKLRLNTKKPFVPLYERNSGTRRNREF
jgi:hypothetical protein